jgi:hypothetical protein
MYRFLLFHKTENNNNGHTLSVGIIKITGPTFVMSQLPSFMKYSRNELVEYIFFYLIKVFEWNYTTYTDKSTMSKYAT